VARPLGPIAALAASLLAVSVAGAGGAGAAQRAIPKRGGTVVVAMNSLAEPACLGWAPICLQNPQWRDKVLARPFLVAPKGYRNDLVAGYRLTRDPFTVTLSHPPAGALERRRLHHGSGLRLRVPDVSGPFRLPEGRPVQDRDPPRSRR